MISKELLSEVLGIEIKEIGRLVEDVLLSFRYPTHWGYINIYELANKCKEWAVKNDKYCIKTQQIDRWFSIEILLGHSIVFCEGYTTEPEAIFKACEYIMEQTK